MSSIQSDRCVYGIKWIFFKNKNILVHGENKINVNASSNNNNNNKLVSF